MDARVTGIAKAALQKLAGQAPAVVPEGPAGGLRIGPITLAQLSGLAYLQAGDPLVEQVLATLKAGRPVYLDRPATEASLGLADYPARVQEQFNRWFSRIAGFGVALTQGGAPVHERPYAGFEAAPATGHLPVVQPVAHPAAARAAALPSPDRQVLAEILGEAVPEPHPCVKEPGKGCCGSGRCKTLGF